MTDGLGHTTGGGQNTLALLSEAMAQSGPVLPQIASTGGMLSGTYCIVTEDGAGPIKAVIDPTGTGAFSKGTMLDVVTQVPGQNGNIAAPKKQKQQRSPWTRITRRAANVNENFPIQVAVPAGIKCTGTVAGQKNVCLVKLANMNKNGPFGGVVAVQMADAQAADAQAAAGKGTTAKGTAGQETA